MRAEAAGDPSALHRAQLRTGSNIPYVSHLLAVCSLVISHGGDEDQAIAALQHFSMTLPKTTAESQR